MSELDLTNIGVGSIATPASGVTAVFVDSVTKSLMSKIDTGVTQGRVINQSVSTPAAAFAADTYLVGSSVAIPNGFCRIGTLYRLYFDVSKTAAGTATPVLIVRFGTVGAIGDAARLTFTFGAATAAADVGSFEIRAMFRVVGASAILQGSAVCLHGTALGLVNVAAPVLQVTSGAFDSTVNNSFIGISVNGGVSAAWSIAYVRAELIND